MIWRTDAMDCVYDLFSFIEEQIRLAESNPADQFAAINAAGGAIPIIQKRLESGEFDLLRTQLELLFGGLVSWQRELGAMDRTEFEAKVDSVLQTLACARSLIEAPPESGKAFIQP